MLFDCTNVPTYLENDIVVSGTLIASFRFEDENEGQVQLLLIVCMLKSVTVMA